MRESMGRNLDSILDQDVVEALLRLTAWFEKNEPNACTTRWNVAGNWFFVTQKRANAERTNV